MHAITEVNYLLKADFFCGFPEGRGKTHLEFNSPSDFFAASLRTGQNQALCAPGLPNTLYGEKVSSYVFCPPPLASAKGTEQSRALQPTLAHNT